MDFTGFKTLVVGGFIVFMIFFSRQWLVSSRKRPFVFTLRRPVVRPNASAPKGRSVSSYIPKIEIVRVFTIYTSFIHVKMSPGT